MNKRNAIIGFVLFFAAGMTVMWGINRPTGARGGSAATQAAWSDSESPVPVTSEDPMWGRRDALVTLVVFHDYECRFSLRNEGVLEQVRNHYGPAKVRVIWKNLPLPHRAAARPAAVAAATVHALAGNAAFWDFHNKAYANQQALTRENFEKWARQLGVDMQKFKEALDNDTYAAKVDQDIALAQKLSADSTPYLFINGKKQGGAVPFEPVKERVDELLQQAQGLVANGTKQDEVYREACKVNFKRRMSKEEMETVKERGASELPDPTLDKTAWKIPVGDAPARGAADALVTVVVFCDFECSFCRSLQPTLEQLLEDYKGRLRIVWKDRPLPIHNLAEATALFAREARKQKGDAGFWAAHDMLFANQPAFDEQDLEGYSKTLELKWAAVKDAIDKKKYGEGIAADVALADAMNADGTPEAFINGRRVSGSQPRNVFKAIVDEELNKAEALVNGGTPKAKVYDTVMKNAKDAL